MEKKNLGFDLLEIMDAFLLNENENCTHLADWINATNEFNDFEKQIIDDLHLEIETSGEYMNEEELKTKIVGLIFYVAKIQVPKKVMLFFERPMSAEINSISLSVICDCIVATPRANAPKMPYFFLQEFKKKKGEKKDPEAQMLTAMLIAQAKNNDDKPVYGAYLIGSSWRFTTLVGNDYCTSSLFEATQKAQLIQIISILRKLREIIINR